MKRNIILIGLLSVFSFAVLGVFGVQAVSVSAETAVEEIVTEESTVEEVAVEETPKEEVTTDTVAWLTDSFVMNFGASVRIGDMVTDENGNVTEVHAEVLPGTIGTNPPEGIRCKGAIHWVSAKYGVQAEVRQLSGEETQFDII